MESVNYGRNKFCDTGPAESGCMDNHLASSSVTKKKSFNNLDAWCQCFKTCPSSLMKKPSKKECLFLEILSSQVYFLQLRSELTGIEHLSIVPPKVGPWTYLEKDTRRLWSVGQTSIGHIPSTYLAPIPSGGPLN